MHVRRALKREHKHTEGTAATPPNKTVRPGYYFFLSVVSSLSLFSLFRPPSLTSSYRWCSATPSGWISRAVSKTVTDRQSFDNRIAVPSPNNT